MLYPVDEVDILDAVTTKLGSRVGSFPTTYLDLPLGASHNSKNAWYDIGEKLCKRLAF